MQVFARFGVMALIRQRPSWRTAVTAFGCSPAGVVAATGLPVATTYCVYGSVADGVGQSENATLVLLDAITVMCD